MADDERSKEGEYEEWGGPSERTFEGWSRGPGCSFERAVQAAARAAAEAGHAGEAFTILRSEVEPQSHNQWVRVYRVIIAVS